MDNKNYHSEFSISTLFYRVIKYNNLGWIKKSQVHQQGIIMIEFPRLFMDAISDFNDLQNQGIYFLIKKDPFPTDIYVGKAQNLYQRLSQHNHEDAKDFNYVIAFSMPGCASAGVADYLEYSYIKKLKSQSYYKTINISPRNEPVTNEYNQSEIQQNMKAIDRLLNLVDINFDFHIENLKNVKKIYGTQSSDIYRFKNASLVYQDNKFIMLKGSKICVEALPRIFLDGPNREKNEQDFLKFSNSFRKHINEHLNALELTDDKQYYTLKEDIPFDSCSTAGMMASGRSTNGWIAWVNDSGFTLDDVYRKPQLK